MFRSALMACLLTLAAGPVEASDLFQAGAADQARIEPSAFALSPGERIALPELDGRQFEAVFDRAETGQPGGRLWVGRVAGGEPFHRVILTEGNGTLFGLIITPEGAWSLGPEYGGGPVVLRADSTLAFDAGPDDMNAVLPAGLGEAARALDASYGVPAIADDRFGQESPAAAVPVGSNGTVDVGLVYTPEYAALYGIATLTRLQYLVNLYDQALIDSDTGMRARLAHAGPLPVVWDELTSMAQTLDDLFAGAGFGNAGTSLDATGTCILSDEPCVNDGDLSSLFSLRNERSIDVIVFMRRLRSVNSRGCGIARVSAQDLIGVMDPAVEHVNGVAVVSDGIDADGSGGACVDLVLAHEIGHNMGLLHNFEFSAPLVGIHDYSYGYQATCEFKTIQSYDSVGGTTCPGNDPPTRPNEVRVVMYSNPDLNTCFGQPCGENLPDGAVADVHNGPVATDAARSLRMAGHNVSLFRDPPAPAVRSAILPYSRAVRNGTAATAFATIVNPASSGGTATGCGLTVHGAAASDFSYQTTDPTTNSVTGTPDTPADIAAGGSQSFVFSLSQNSSFSGSDVHIDAGCANRRSAENISGVNTFRFLSTALALPDIVALAATVSGTGVVELPGETGAAAFSVAIANIGVLSNVTVRATAGESAAPIGLIELCRTDPQSGSCVTPRSASRIDLIDENQTMTFAVFVRGAGPLVHSPATNRVFVTFTAPGGQSVGATSVAVRTAN